MPISLVDTTTASASSADVSITLPVAPLASDVIVLSVASGTSAGFTTPGGWVNPLGGNTDVETDAHQHLVIAHAVSSGEAGQTVWNLPGLYGTIENFTAVAGLFRGVNPTSIFNTAATDSDSNLVTTAETPLLSPTVTDGQVVAFISRDSGVAALAAPPAGWTVEETTSDKGYTKATHAMVMRTALTTSGVNVPVTSFGYVTGSDEFISIAFVLNPSTGWSGSFVRKSDGARSRVRMANGAGASVRLSSGSRL